MNKTSARLFGIFFLFSFLSYALGTGLMATVQDPASLPDDIVRNKGQIVFGGILIVLFHTLFNLSLLVIMFNAVKYVNYTLSALYMAFGAFGTLLLASGAVFLLLPVSVSENTGQSERADPLYFQTILSVCSNGNFYAYQLGMTAWGIAGILLCGVLYRSKLVPVFFPVWGLTGYLIFITGTLLEVFGYPYGMLLSVPGGLFEIALSVRLIFRGFSPVRNTV